MSYRTEVVLFETSRDAAEFARHYVENLSALMATLDFEAIGRVAELLDRARHEGRTIFFLGNGGSATTAMHFALDLDHSGTVDESTPFRAVSLVENTGVVTAYANDIGYERVFEKQLVNLMRPGDVVVGISASGNSPNLLRAFEYAAKHGGVTVGLVGFDGGKLAPLSQHAIVVRTPPKQYGPVEDVHLVLNHIFTSFLRQRQLARTRA